MKICIVGAKLVIACVAWRFKQLTRLWRSLSRLSRFPVALKLLKNRQATQAKLVKTVSN